MRYRRLITLLLVLALPLPGLAGLGRAQAPCPMQAESHETMPAHHGSHGEALMASEAAPQADAGAHCCDDATFALLGGACQPGQHCQSVSVTVFLTTGIGLRTAPADLPGFDPPDPGGPPKASPTSIWRPPAV